VQTVAPWARPVGGIAYRAGRHIRGAREVVTSASPVGGNATTSNTPGYQPVHSLISRRVATVALIDDLLGDLIQEFPFLLCEFLVGEDARVAQRGQLTKLGGDAGDRAAGRGLRRRRLSGSRGRPNPLPTARAAAECSAAASPSQAVAAASIGPEPGPVYIRAELISGGSAAKSMSVPPIGSNDARAVTASVTTYWDGAAKTGPAIDRTSFRSTCPARQGGRHRAERTS
jgi:hypothetical protein